MAYVPPYPSRPRLAESDRESRLRGGWNLLGPVGLLLAWPVAIILGLPSAFGLIACLFTAMLFFTTGHVLAGMHSLVGAVLCGVLVTIAFAPLSTLRR